MAKPAITEHHLQKLLASRWMSEGVTIAGEKVTLVAWEVMFPSWRINDAHMGFGEPAIDFLAVDGCGGLVAIELKPRIGGEKAALRACCQVSHLTALIDRTRSAQTLKRAHDACYSGVDGRTGDRAARLPKVDLTRPTRAVLAAPSWSAGAASVVMGFSRRPWAANVDRLRELGMLTASGANRVCRRYAGLSDFSQPTVETLVIDLPDSADT